MRHSKNYFSRSDQRIHRATHTWSFFTGNNPTCKTTFLIYFKSSKKSNIDMSPSYYSKRIDRTARPCAWHGSNKTTARIDKVLILFTLIRCGAHTYKTVFSL